jgi:Fe-S-cluster-containing hydrogenase component 2
MIEVDLARCAGCRSCETACSFFRSGRVGRIISRIRVINSYESGIDGPVACVQCAERYCLNCPESALTLGPLGQVVASPTRCRACGKCARRCPIGAIELHRGIVYVCDLCGGRPRCVQACSLGAITFSTRKGEAISLAEQRARVRRLNPSERRAEYVKVISASVRSAWRPSDG